MCFVYFVLTGLATAAWIALLVVGILVDSKPLRANLSLLLSDSPLSLEHWLQTLKTLTAVTATYTYSNVCLLAMLASYLGGIAATVNIGPDGGTATADQTYPRTSSLLRGFLIALALLAGVLLTSDNAFDPTQSQYYKTAGFVSLTAFLASLSPDLMKRLIDQFSGFILQSSRPQRFVGTDAKGKVNTDIDIHFTNAELADQQVSIVILDAKGHPETVPGQTNAAGTMTAPWHPVATGRYRVTHPTSAEHLIDVS